MRRVAAAWSAAAALLTAAAFAQTPYPDGLYGEIHAPKGTIAIRLFFERTPLTVANFVGLAEGTIANEVFPAGRPFFDGSTFHRVVPGHVIQGGRPPVEGVSGSGTPIPTEIDERLSHRLPGMVGMASAGPHTATSQFYITLGDRSYLDGDYALFGEVVRGMEVVDAIVADDPIDSVRVVRVGERAAAFRPTTATWRDLIVTVRDRVAAREARQRATEAEYLRRHWPDATHTEAGWSYVVLEEGAGSSPSGGGGGSDTVIVQYTGRTVPGLRFRSAGERGEPGFQEGERAGRPFPFVVGTSTVTPGLDAAVADMSPGERRIVVVPAALGYGVGGYYAPPVTGQPRFVIRPNTLLIYDVIVRHPN